MLETGFVTRSEYQKHIRGEWRTVHDLWRHIRNYMTSYAQPGGFTQGSIAYADADGFLTENNANFFWDATNHRLGIGTATPDVSLDIEFPAVASVVSRVSAKTRPWRHWECIDGNWGFALGIDANDKKFYINYDSPIGTMQTRMLIFDALNSRIGVFNLAPAYPFDVTGNTRITGSLVLTGGISGALSVSGLLSNLGGAKLEIQGGVDGTSARGIFMWDTTSTSWGIYVSQSGAGKSLADGVACTDFSGSTGHHFRFRISDTADRSFVWENSSETCLMDLEGDTGNLAILGNLDVRGGSIVSNSGAISFGDENLVTTGTFGAGQTTLAKATLGDDGRGLSSIFTLSANPAKSDGIAFYSEGHIGAITTDGPTYGAGIWLNIDAGATLGADVRALDIGIYEAGATCAGRNAYGLAIHLEFDDTDPPAAIYPFRINCNDTPGHATPDALIFAPNVSALGLVTGDPGTADDAYLKIKLQDGSVYRIPLVKE